MEPGEWPVSWNYITKRGVPGCAHGERFETPTMSKAVTSRDVSARDVAKISEIGRLVEQDKTPWYRKKSLRMLYFTLVPAALGVEMTSGYDGSVLNGLQAVNPWNTYFDNPNGSILGVLTAAFNIGAVLALPVVPYCNDRWGRKFCVVFGSILTTIGAILQGASVNSEASIPFSKKSADVLHLSWHVPGCTTDHGYGHSIRH